MIREILPLAGIALAILAALALAARALLAMAGDPLKPWHRYAPREPSADQIDRMDWQQWLAREDRIFNAVRTNVSERLPPDDRTAGNRYWPQSPLYPAALPQDYNRSYTLHPEGGPRGVVVLLHGLTDSCYSLHHLGRLACAAGHAVVAVRIPGHGTVPAGLARVHRRQWAAAARLALREAARIAGDRPVSIMGYSSGAALGLAHALAALRNPALKMPARLILISPMIGISEFARFAGLAALPAIIPAFSRAAWISILPENNPFKYNSFPANGAVQAHRLTRDVQASIDAAQASGTLAGLPPVLAFQSVVDSTVRAAASVDRFMNRLPPSGALIPHELVLFDINRAAAPAASLQASAAGALAELADDGPHPYRTTIIANATEETADTVVRTVEPGATAATSAPLGLPYPPNIVSLSHVALPFPVDDSLYGLKPEEAEPAAAHLAVRGELGILADDSDQFARLTCNPFFPWLARRVLEALPQGPE